MLWALSGGLLCGALLGLSQAKAQTPRPVGVAEAAPLQERPEVGPGQFKLLANRAGNTEFVSPDRVRGTLVQAS
jgi:hypothetical protein